MKNNRWLMISDPMANDFCPTPLPDATLYLGSNRAMGSESGATGTRAYRRRARNPLRPRSLQ